MRLAAEYSNLDFNKLIELDCVTYRILVRDAFVYSLEKTEAGREYLENAWLMQQTKPDKNKLKKVFNKGGVKC